MEIDWSRGQILSTLDELGLDDNTLVVLGSDNGPWLSYGDHAGSAKPLREGKTITFDGGQRVPCIMRWPGKIPASSSKLSEAGSGNAIFPTHIGPSRSRIQAVSQAGTAGGRSAWNYVT